MTLMTAKPEVLKQDARGRVRVPLERRKALLDEFEKSGLSAAKFARLAGINYATFAGWAQQRRKDRASSVNTAMAARPLPEVNELPATASATPIRLFEAVMESTRSNEDQKPFAPTGLSIDLPGGSHMQVDSPAQLQMAAELVALIAKSLRARC